MNIIDGLRITISGSELIQMAQDKADYAEKRISKLEEALTRVEGMDPEDRELAGFKTRGGDMKEEVKSKLKNQQQNRRYYSFLASHLEAGKTYRISSDSGTLKKLGISHSDRY
jgi:hypothetical protein